MTSGKKADSAMPRNHRSANTPPNLCVAAISSVHDPKLNIRIGSTREGPNFLPSIATGGAKSTYGTKKIPTIRLYWPSLKPRSTYPPQRKKRQLLAQADLLFRWVLVYVGRPEGIHHEC